MKVGDPVRDTDGAVGVVRDIKMAPGGLGGPAIRVEIYVDWSIDSHAELKVNPEALP